MPLTTPTNHTSTAVFGGFFDEEDHDLSSQKHNNLQAVGVTTVKSDEDISIDNSQMFIENSKHSSRTNTSGDSSSKQPKTTHSYSNFLPVLNEQSTYSTKCSSSSSYDSSSSPSPKMDIYNVKDQDEDDSKAPPQRKSPSKSHMEATRHAHNLSWDRNAMKHVAVSLQIIPPTSAAKNTSSKTKSKSKMRLNEVPEATTVTSPLSVDYNRLDDDDATDKAAAWAIHFALIFFFSLVCISLVLSFLVIEMYGFVTLLFMSLVVGFCLLMAYFVDKTILSKNERLKPIRSKIVNVVEATKQVIVQEYDNFKADWVEYSLLLTNEEYYNNEKEEEDVEENTTNPTTPKMIRKKSVMFKLVKPFLGAKRKLFRRKQNKHKEPSTIRSV